MKNLFTLDLRQINQKILEKGWRKLNYSWMRTEKMQSLRIVVMNRESFIDLLKRQNRRVEENRNIDCKKSKFTVERNFEWFQFTSIIQKVSVLRNRFVAGAKSWWKLIHLALNFIEFIECIGNWYLQLNVKLLSAEFIRFPGGFS